MTRHDGLETGLEGMDGNSERRIGRREGENERKDEYRERGERRDTLLVPLQEREKRGNDTM